MAYEELISNYTIYRLTLTDANTEYSQAITAQPCRFTVSLDDLTSTARFTLTSGASGTGKRIFQGGEWHTPKPFGAFAKTIYAQSPNAGAILVIEEYKV